MNPLPGPIIRSQGTPLLCHEPFARPRANCGKSGLTPAPFGNNYAGPMQDWLRLTLLARPASPEGPLSRVCHSSCAQAAFARAAPVSGPKMRCRTPAFPLPSCRSPLRRIIGPSTRCLILSATRRVPGSLSI